MRCNSGIEDSILAWLGRFSVGLALFAVPVCLVDPVALLVSFVALILGGFSAIAGKLRYVVIDGLIVTVTIVLVFVTFPPAPEVSWSTGLMLGLRMFVPPYLIAVALAVFGRWRLRRRSRPAPTPQADAS